MQEIKILIKRAIPARKQAIDTADGVFTKTLGKEKYNFEQTKTISCAFGRSV